MIDPLIYNSAACSHAGALVLTSQGSIVLSGLLFSLASASVITRYALGSGDLCA